MKWNALALLPAIFVSLLLLGCRKNDFYRNRDAPVAERFFDVPADAPAVVQRIAAAARGQEERFHFIDKVARTDGYPLWGNAMVLKPPRRRNTLSNGPDSTVVLIPLVLLGTQYVNSFMTCLVADTVSIRLLRGGDYAAYGFHNLPDSLSAQKIASTCMLLEYRAFNHDMYQVKDRRLFNHVPGGALPSKTTIRLRPAPTPNAFVTFFYSYEVEVNNSLNEVECPPGQACQWTHTETVFASYTVWVEDIPGGSDTFGADYNPWAGSGYDPCNGVPCTPVIEGWQYIPPPPPPARDTCDPYIKVLQNDTTFTGAFSRLASHAVLSKPYEVGIVVANRVTGTYVEKNGDVNAPEIYWSMGMPVDGLIHSHYSGLNSIFSVQDMVYMAQIFKAGYVRDTANLFFGVTSNDGHPYLVKVHNLAAYRAFVNKILASADEMNKFRRNYADVFNYAEFDKNEKGFLKMIEKEMGGKGLSLYRGNDACTEWAKLTLDSFGEVKQKTCE